MFNQISIFTHPLTVAEFARIIARLEITPANHGLGSLTAGTYVGADNYFVALNHYTALEKIMPFGHEHQYYSAFNYFALKARDVLEEIYEQLKLFARYLRFCPDSILTRFADAICNWSNFCRLTGADLRHKDSMIELLIGTGSEIAPRVLVNQWMIDEVHNKIKYGSYELGRDRYSIISDAIYYGGYDPSHFSHGEICFLSDITDGKGVEALQDMLEFKKYIDDYQHNELCNSTGLLSMAHICEMEERVFGARLSDGNNLCCYCDVMQEPLENVTRQVINDLNQPPENVYIPSAEKNRLREAAYQLGQLGYLNEHTITNRLDAYAEDEHGTIAHINDRLFGVINIEGTLEISVMKFSVSDRAQGKLNKDEYGVGTYGKGIRA